MTSSVHTNADTHIFLSSKSTKGVQTRETQQQQPVKKRELQVDNEMRK